ncbi:DNA binding protein [Aureococcus anophagefferens]|nr:DNA binding protein [Aureococcus anophagefferens]
MLDGNYYYAKTPGEGDRAFYWVEGVDGDPVFHETAAFVVSEDLFEDSVLGVAPNKEVDGEDAWIVDGVAGGAYLIGLGQAFEVFVVRLDGDGAPEAYAVVDAVTVNWASKTPEDGTSAFGAAFSYRSRDWDVYYPFFASNEGWGMFQLDLPLEIPDECWNTGTDTLAHAACAAERAIVHWRGPSADASSNDGMNCALGGFIVELPPTPAPAAEPGRRPSRAQRRRRALPRRELDLVSGEYHSLYELGYLDVDDHVNAIALYEWAVDAYYMYGSLAGYLCVFDRVKKWCLDTPLAEAKPNAGTILGANYYYAKEPGMGGDRAVYWVEGLDAAAPVFHEDYGFVVPDDLFTRSVLDFAPLKEERDDVWIDDGEDKGEYLVGLAQAFELVVVRLGDDGAPEAYAVFFASNEGWGLFELELPVVVPEACWNADEKTRNHVVCEASSASIVYRMASLDASSNDGLNCETQAFVAFEDPTRAPTTGDPTPAPSFEPSRAPSAQPTYAPTSAAPSEGAVEPFDCAAAGNPIQVLREKDDEHYRVAELDVLTGAYHTLYELDFLDLDAHVNALAMYDAAVDEYYAYGSFAGYLCVFDRRKRSCFDTPLAEEKPNAGAILGANYYYAKEPGMGGDRAVYWVEGLDTDAPVFHEDYGFVVPQDLFTRSVLDFAPLEEKRDDVWIDDGENKGEYLVGLAQAFELFVVRLGDDGAPAAYAVLESDVDWGLGKPETGTSAFGAAFGYREGYEWYGLSSYFASNEGWGIFELELPVVVPEACWNTGFETETHAVCDGATASLTRVTDSADASSNDGLNCPLGSFEAPVFPTAAPTHPPTTYAPTAAPSESPVEPFDCEAHPAPLQVMREGDDEPYAGQDKRAKFPTSKAPFSAVFHSFRLIFGRAIISRNGLEAPYGVFELDVESGDYAELFDLSYFDGHVNAVAMGISDAGDHYLVGAFTGDGDDLARLCVFDAAKTRCFEELALAKPNVGAILRQDDGAEHFYYAKEPGYGGEGRFGGSTARPSWTSSPCGSRRATTAAPSRSSTTASAACVVGLGQRFELLIVRLADDGYPEDFAVLESDVDWGDEPARDDKSAYGAAFLTSTAGLPDVLFASNEGWGIFRLKLPVAVPDDCWNTGFDAAAQSVCAGARAALERTSNSAEATSNDGMNCPFGYYDTPAPSAEPPAPTAAPTYGPSASVAPSAAPTYGPTAPPSASPVEAAPSAAPTPYECGFCWSDLSVEAADCAVLPLRFADDDEGHAVVELDGGSGAYGAKFDVPYYTRSLGGLALYESREGCMLFGAFGNRLCRFDDSHATCFYNYLDEQAPAAATVVGDTYYYAAALPGAIHRVEAIHGDDAVFVEGAIVVDVDAPPVYDLAPLLDGGGDDAVVGGAAGDLAGVAAGGGRCSSCASRTTRRRSSP